MEDLPFATKAALHTADLSATRATFLAGFAYYEIGRYGFARYEDPTYIFFQTGVFALSVFSAFLSSFIRFYVFRSPTDATKDRFVARITPFVYVGCSKCVCDLSLEHKSSF